MTFIASTTNSTTAVTASVVSSSIEKITSGLSSFLSVFSAPPVVILLGLALVSSFTGMHHTVLSTPTDQVNFVKIKFFNLFSYVLNCIAFNIFKNTTPKQIGPPISLEVTENVSKKKNDEAKPTKDTMRSIFHIEPTKSLLNPSDWVYLIWIPILVGEFVLSTVGAIIRNEKGSIGSVAIQTSAPGFSFAQIFQSLWFVSLRPKLWNAEKYPFIADIVFNYIMTALNTAHSILCTIPLSPIQYIIYHLPISLHFGWISILIIIHFNKNIGIYFAKDRALIARTGYVSAIVATIVGVTVTVSRSAPVYGLVFAWALAACSTGLNKRIQDLKRSPDLVQQAGYYGAPIQQLLCRIGSTMLSITAIIVTITSIIDPNNRPPFITPPLPPFDCKTRQSLVKNPF